LVSLRARWIKQQQLAGDDTGYPAAILSTRNIALEYRRLKKLGVKFRGAPRKTRSARFVFFDDTCGNFIVLLEQK
jgi:hypothetical protein